MDTNKTYTFIGYDLGDGETIVDMSTLDNNSVKKSVQTLFKAITMPDNNDPGKAMPTTFGYNKDNEIVFSSTILVDPENVKDIQVNFKRRPSDLIQSISNTRQNEIIKMLSQGWPDAGTCPELNTEDLLNFKKSVVTFTDGIFEYPQLKKVIHDEAVDSDEIVFCVGHPTRWNDFDVEIYRAILKTSVIGKGAYAGKGTSMTMAAESRAAFLYVKEKTEASVLPKDTSALLIDIGSSTIDITAMTSDSRNYKYNSGNNYLGARFFDHAIKDIFLDSLRKDVEEWNVYESLVSINPLIDNSISLSCRKAKEEVFSVAAHKSRILFADLVPKRIELSDIEKIAETTPVADVLKRYFNVPQKELDAMGKKSWNELFMEFLQETKAELEAHNIKIGRIIMTGSASKMTFVPKIIKGVFHEVSENNVLNDADPSRTISMGLALVGPSNEKSKGFQEELEKIIKKEVPEIVNKDIEKLADPISTVINDVVADIVFRRINEWKNMKIKTLNDMTERIKQDCSENNLNRTLSANKTYNDAVNNWTVNVVGKDIAVKLKSLCEKYGVNNLTLDNLNVMKVSSVKVEGLTFDPTKDIADATSAVIAVVAGIIAAIVLPFVLGFVIGLISYISVSLASALLGILLSIPGAGWAILLGVAGVTVIVAATKGGKKAKETLSAKLQTMNLPQWVRNRMTDEKISKELNKANIKTQIKDSILKAEAKKKITSSVSDALSEQIKRRVDDIKYVIESK